MYYFFQFQDILEEITTIPNSIESTTTTTIDINTISTTEANSEIIFTTEPQQQTEIAETSRSGLPRRLNFNQQQQNSINDIIENRKKIDDSRCWNVQFDCGNRTCIDINQRCNGIQDCLNGSDEENCGQGIC